MTSPFEQMTNDIFSNPDFTESAVIAGRTVPVIASEIAVSPEITAFGRDAGVSFFLRVKASDLPQQPEQNQRVIFRSTEFRIDDCAFDSAALVYRIDLKSKSSR